MTQNNKNIPVVDAKNIRHAYTHKNNHIHVLNDITFQLQPATMTALVGPSGAGKSTLLHIIGLLEKPNAGSLTLLGKQCHTSKDNESTALRAQKIGFIYQFHHLLQGFNARENIAIAQRIIGKNHAEAIARADQLLDKMSLKHRAYHYPQQLSGGEQQRVAVARAIANKPKILLADEPTGNLDPKTAENVFDEMYTLCQKEKIAMLIATHNMALAGKMHRIIYLKNGTVSEMPPSS